VCVCVCARVCTRAHACQCSQEHMHDWMHVL